MQSRKRVSLRLLSLLVAICLGLGAVWISAPWEGNPVRADETSDLQQRNQELEAQRALTGGARRVFADASESTIRHRWQTYCDHNGIPYCSLYELRHTFVSIAQNLPEGQLKALVGHSRSMDTYGVYAHEVQGQTRQISTALDQLFSLYE